MKESTEFFNETAAKDNADALEKIKASGKTEIHVLTGGKGLDRQADAGAHRDAGRFGKDFIERIYKASGFTPPQS